MVALKKRLIPAWRELQREYYDLLKNPDSQDLLLWLTEVEHMVAKLRSQRALGDIEVYDSFKDAIITAGDQYLGLLFLAIRERTQAFAGKARHYIRQMACARTGF